MSYQVRRAPNLDRSKSIQDLNCSMVHSMYSIAIASFIMHTIQSKKKIGPFIYSSVSRWNGLHENNGWMRTLFLERNTFYMHTLLWSGNNFTKVMGYVVWQLLAFFLHLCDTFKLNCVMWHQSFSSADLSSSVSFVSVFGMKFGMGMKFLLMVLTSCQKRALVKSL